MVESKIPCEQCKTTGIATKTNVFGEYKDVCYVCGGFGYKADEKLYSYAVSTDLLEGRIFVNAKGLKFPIIRDVWNDNKLMTLCPFCGDPMKPMSFKFGIICHSEQCKGKQVH